MAVDKEQIKKKIFDRLPKLLPGLLKTVIVHIIMLIYHISMPPWVIAMKVKKGLRSCKGTNESYTEESEPDRRISRRRMRRRERRRR